MERQAFEPTGLVPRSIIRTFDRFRQQLLPETKAAAVQEFRISRYQVLVSVKSLLSLVLVPLVINFLARTFLLNPATEYLWNTQQNEIFLNSYQEDRALREIHDFSEKVYFESLLGEEPAPTIMAMHKQDNQGSRASQAQVSPGFGISLNGPRPPYWPEDRKIGEKVPRPLRWDEVPPKAPKAIEASQASQASQGFGVSLNGERAPQPLAKTDLTDAQRFDERVVGRGGAPPPQLPHPNEPSAYLFDHTVGVRRPEPANEGEAVANQFQDKAVELALIYNKESMLAITNVLGDFVTFVTIASLFVWMRPQIVILKSFLTESIYSLSDTTKSFLLILVTDLLVGFHSPRGWEIGIEMLLRHFGLPENQDFIFLFVAAFPVFLDTIFKYWIFRYLNKISPSTVATYHNMIE
uniref:Potassium/proton antiporter CemA n=2 Tax=Coccomyxaceae TaxID=35472 RepID=A0A097KNW7_9CHLO|nr:chloroplast enveloppe membrane protein [Paradoxia multiseta]AIT94904.1 chloroplast enveloppe membrane protein [Paradoxia multiseta]